MGNFRQKYLLAFVILADIFIMETIFWLGHMKDSVPLGLIIAVTTFAGYMVAYMEYKWKRDREMARIVADRLMHKPDTSSIIQDNTNAQMAMNSYNTLGSLLSKNSIAGLGGAIKTHETLRQYLVEKSK